MKITPTHERSIRAYAEAPACPLHENYGVGAMPSSCIQCHALGLEAVSALSIHPWLTRRLVSDVLDAVIIFATDNAAGNPDPMPNKTALKKVITLLAERGHVIGAPMILEEYKPL